MKYRPMEPETPPLLRCEVCEIEDGEELQNAPPAIVTVRVCGRVLCDDHYLEHMQKDRSVGIWGYSACRVEAEGWDSRY